MLDSARINGIIEELEGSAASDEEARAVLQSGAEVVECARLAANRAALYRIAAGLLRASLQPGQSVDVASVFRPESEYYLTDIVFQEKPVVIPELPESTGTKVANKALAVVLVSVLVLAIVGLIALVSSIL